MRASLTLLFSASIVFVLATGANAQGPGNPRLFGIIPAVTLAQLEEVQTATNLTEEQRKEALSLQEDLTQKRRDLFQNAAGDFEAAGRELAKLYTSLRDKLAGMLDEGQSKRLHEIYLQVNGPMALTDEAVQKELELSAEQNSDLDAAVAASRSEMFSKFQDFQNMSADERAKAGNELVESRDESLIAVLNDTQKQKFEAAKGEKMDIDLSKLPGPGR